MCVTYVGGRWPCESVTLNQTPYQGRSSASPATHGGRFRAWHGIDRNPAAFRCLHFNASDKLLSFPPYNLDEKQRVVDDPK